MLSGGLITPEMQDSPQSIEAAQSTRTQSNPKNLVEGSKAGCFRGITGTARAIIVARRAAVKPSAVAPQSALVSLYGSGGYQGVGRLHVQILLRQRHVNQLHPRCSRQPRPCCPRFPLFRQPAILNFLQALARRDFLLHAKYRVV